VTRRVVDEIADHAFEEQTIAIQLCRLERARHLQMTILDSSRGSIE